MLKKVLLVCFAGLLAWAYQETRPAPPKTCGSKDGPQVTAPRIQLKDGRFLAYKEFGVPKDKAKHKIVFIHGFDSCRHDVSAITTYLNPVTELPFCCLIASYNSHWPLLACLSHSQDIVQTQGLYIVSFDRPGYGESDPNPIQTRKSIAFDIEQLADQLKLGSRFYVVGYSLGGETVWTCLKYIPHRWVWSFSSWFEGLLCLFKSRTRLSL